jgi:channel protein (hemolysin III family)
MSPHRDLVALLGIAEPLSSLTHLACGLLLSLLGVALVRRARGRGPITAGVVLYALFVTAMFLASGTYHALPAVHPLRGLFWRLDHASIWTGLAATFAAVRLVHCERRVVPAVVGLWAIALAGVTVEMATIRDLPPWISPSLYILMGWCGLPTVLLAGRMRGWRHALPLLAAGVVVTLGGLMDATQWPPPLVPRVVEAHELLHLTTIVGGVAYFRAIWLGVADVPVTEPAAEPALLDAATTS